MQATPLPGEGSLHVYLMSKVLSLMNGNKKLQSTFDVGSWVSIFTWAAPKLSALLPSIFQTSSLFDPGPCESGV